MILTVKRCTLHSLLFPCLGLEILFGALTGFLKTKDYPADKVVHSTCSKYEKIKKEGVAKQPPVTRQEYI